MFTPEIAERLHLISYKTVLITGASQGMGLEAARQLSAKGANVIIVARNQQKLEAALKGITVRLPTFFFTPSCRQTYYNP